MFESSIFNTGGSIFDRDNSDSVFSTNEHINGFQSIFADNSSYTNPYLKNAGSNNFRDRLNGSEIRLFDVGASGEISLADQYAHKALDKRVMGGQYNITLTDVYKDKSLGAAHFGTNTDGFIATKNNTMRENDFDKESSELLKSTESERYLSDSTVNDFESSDPLMQGMHAEPFAFQADWKQSFGGTKSKGGLVDKYKDKKDSKSMGSSSGGNDWTSTEWKEEEDWKQEEWKDKSEWKNQKAKTSEEHSKDSADIRKKSNNAPVGQSQAEGFVSDEQVLEALELEMEYEENVDYRDVKDHILSKSFQDIKKIVVEKQQKLLESEDKSEQELLKSEIKYLEKVLMKKAMGGK